jgi:ABC-type sulfate transport system permease subunit
MRLKSAALFALIGMILRTVLLAAGFIRDLLSFVREQARETTVQSGLLGTSSLALAHGFMAPATSRAT